MRRTLERAACVWAIALSACAGELSDIPIDRDESPSQDEDTNEDDDAAGDESPSSDDPSTGDGDGDGDTDEPDDPSDPDDPDGPDDPSDPEDPEEPEDPEDPPPPIDNSVPEGAHCASVAAWDPQATQFEAEVLLLTNEARAVGHNCDSEGNFGPTHSLTMEPHLRCSSRLHSLYMATTQDFNHTQTQTGLDPFERMEQAGFSFGYAGENIAYGQQTPKEVVDGWLDSDGHCSNIMSPDYTVIGVGYAIGTADWNGQEFDAPYWTQNFAAPR